MRTLLLMGAMLLMGTLSAQSSLATYSAVKQKAFTHTPLHQQEKIQLCDLELGQIYEILLSSSTSGPRIVGEAKEALRSLKFEAKASCRFITLEWPKGSRLNPLEIQIKSLEKPVGDAEKQMGIMTTVDNDVAHLVRDVFIGGDCFDVGAFSFQGVNGQIGTFSNGMSSIGIDEGIVIATGNVGVAEGPNDRSNAGGTVNGNTYDPDFFVLAGGEDVLDRASIEFEFTPTVSQVSFEYVFASDEYCEWVGSQFNDKFGFFISGPGINGPFFMDGDNIAIVPGTSDYVEINTVNSGSNPAFFVDNNPAGQNPGCNTGGGPAVNDFQFDGFTTVLTAVANVIPCQTYRIRLKVADLGDGNWDSAVFLKANSFNAGTTASLSAVATGNTVSATAAYEGCGDGTITFTRNGADLDQDFVINYTFSSLTTATPGADFISFPNPVVIPAGQTSVTFNLGVIADGIYEGIEFVVIEIENACSCLTNEVIFEIHDPPPLDAIGTDELICANAPATLMPMVSGGVPGYTYLWEDGSTGPSLTIQDTEPTGYAVTVSDNCGQETIAFFNVIPLAPVAVLSDTLKLCPDNPVGVLTVNVAESVGPYDVTYTVNGTPFTEFGLNGSPLELNVYLPGVYELVSVVSNGCPADVSGIGIVEVLDVAADINTTDPSCFGADDGVLNVNVTAGDAPFSYDWADSLPDTNVIEGQGPGDYALTLSDANGCTTELTASLTEPPLLDAAVTQLTTIDCDTPNALVQIATSGGSAPYTYLWSDGDTLSNRTDLLVGNYSLTVSDTSACIQIIDLEVIGDFVTPEVEAGPSFELDCINQSVTLDADGPTQMGNFAYEWSSPTGIIINGGDGLTPSVGSADWYYLEITNLDNSCSSIDSVQVLENSQAPSVVLLRPDTINCSNASVLLDGSQSDFTTDYQANWSLDGQPLSQTDLNLSVDQAGEYRLEIFNPATGCTGQNTVLVPIDTILPFLEISPPEELTCYQPSISLFANADAQGDPFSSDWSALSGSLSDIQNLSASTADAGIYQLTITNDLNGCTRTETVEVSIDQVIPSVTAGDGSLLNCAQPTFNLQASVDQNPNVQSYWLGPTGDTLSTDANQALSIDAAGTYQVKVFDVANGCSNEDVLLIEEDFTPASAVIATPDILNCTQTELSLSATASSQGGFSYSWQSTDGNIVSGADGLTPVINTIGTYELLVTHDVSLCDDSAQVTVGIDTLAPQIQIAPPSQLDCQITQLSLNANVTVGSSTYDLIWQTPDGHLLADSNSLQPIIDEPGTYTLQITDTANGCQSEASISVSVDPNIPIADAGPDRTITCTEPSVSLNGDLSTTGANITYEWSGLGSSPTDVNNIQSSVSEPGTYILSVRNTDNACVRFDTVSVGIDTISPIAVIAEADLLTCAQTSLNLDGNGSSTGDEFQYQWTGNGVDVVTGSTSLSPTIDQAGTYTLLITDDSNGCTAQMQVTVEEDVQAPEIAFNEPGILTCTNTESTLLSTITGNGPFDYTWSTSNGAILSDTDNDNLVVNGAGQYQLSVIDQSNGCVQLATLDVLIDTIAPAIDLIDVPELSCNEPSQSLLANVTGTGPYTYVWNGPAEQIVNGADGPSPLINGPGLYSTTITDLHNGCSNVATQIVDQDINVPELDVVPPDVLTCTLTEVSVSVNVGNSGNFDYVWSDNNGSSIPNSNSNTINVNQPGTYQMQLTNTDNGCFVYDTVMVDIDTIAPIAMVADADILTCTQTSLSLDGDGSSTGNEFQYQWSGSGLDIVAGSNSLSPTINQSGTYTLLVIDDSNGCTAQAQVTVEEDIQLPEIAFNNPDILTCDNTESTLLSTVSGNGPFDYTWTTSDGAILSDINDENLTVNGAGEYQLSVIDQSNGCVQLATLIVLIDTIAPQINLMDVPELSCNEPTQSLLASVMGTGPYTYVWDGPTGQIVNGADGPSPLVNGPGLYSTTITDLHNGCHTIANQLVQQDISVPVVNVVPPDVLTCAQTEVSLSVNVSTGGTITYAWFDNNGSPVPNSNAATIHVNQPGTYQMQLVNTDNGCQVERQFEVSQDIMPPLANAGPMDTLHCNQTWVSLDASLSNQGNIYSYQWSGASITQGSQSISPTVNAAGIYSLAVTNTENGCTSFDETLVIELLPQELDLNIIQPPCFGETGQIQIVDATGGLPPYDYDISGSFVVSNGNSFTISQAGSYTITATDQNGCRVSEVAQIIMPEPFEIGLRPTIEIDFGDSVQLELLLNVPESDIAEIQWSPADDLSCNDCLLPWAAPDQSQEYQVQVWSINGCYAEADIYFTVDRRPNIYIPSGFSPNGDQTNDVFVVYASAKQVKQVNSLQIYNRWGESVFEVYNFPPNDPSYGWDGSFRGKAMNPAVFVYWTEVELIDGTKVLLKGGVTLAK